jgi:hypothetical protein
MQEYTQTIRAFIANPRRQYKLRKKEALWFQLCSSLDVIEDTQLAVASYEAGEVGTSHGARYLAVYGLLQALFVQQDAALNLCEALGAPASIDDYPALKAIREIRTETIGHPTNKKRGKKSQPPSYHFITRMSLRPGGSRYHSRYGDGGFESKEVSIPELVADQTRSISAILTSLANKIEHQDVAHKEQFSMEKLASLFPPSLDYDCRKVIEGTTVRQSASHAAISLQLIKQAVQDFREALARRGIELDTYDCVKYVYELLEYPLGELEGFFTSARGAGVSNIHDKTAYIFAYFVREQVAKLRDVAQEIDDDYSS